MRKESVKATKSSEQRAGIEYARLVNYVLRIGEVGEGTTVATGKLADFQRQVVQPVEPANDETTR